MVMPDPVTGQRDVRGDEEPEALMEIRQRLRRRRPSDFVPLASLLGLARELKGWSLRELESKSGVSNALLSQIETGKVKDPGFATVVLIADALGLSLDRCAACVRPPVEAIDR